MGRGRSVGSRELTEAEGAASRCHEELFPSVEPNSMSRRRFLRTGAGAVLVPTLGACLHNPTGPSGDPAGNAQLTARPREPTLSPEVGETALDLGLDRDGFLYVPASYDPDVPAPMLVALHGATGESSNWTGFFGACESRGMVLLAVDSRSRTWDRVGGMFGSDVPFIDGALNHAFDRCNIDPARIGLLGFSDGASYALSLGPSNGDLFPHLIAFSPGHARPSGVRPGSPRIFISHGTLDQVLSVSTTSEYIVPSLRAAGYDVTYHEFRGRHAIPLEVLTAALDWFLT